MDVRRFTVALLALALFASAAEASRRAARGPTGTFKGVIAADTVVALVAGVFAAAPFGDLSMHRQTHAMEVGHEM